MTHLTAIVLTYNEENYIKDCLKSIAFTDTQIVFDSYSTDKTVEIATQMKAKVIKNEFKNFAEQRNAALLAVADSTDWVLFVDADERVPNDLAEEIRLVIMQNEAVGYQIPRHNFIFGKLTKGAGWYPDYQTRLLKVGKSHYENPVHEVVILEGERGTLSNHFIHHNYRDLPHFIQTQEKYVRYDAKIMFDKGIKPKPQNYILQPLRHFKWRFFELKGYTDGWHGFKLSTLMAWYELKKYMILRRLWNQKEA